MVFVVVYDDYITCIKEFDFYTEFKSAVDLVTLLTSKITPDLSREQVVKICEVLGMTEDYT